MIFRVVAVLLMASLCAAQTPVPVPVPAAPATATGSITVPPETAVAMTLANSIKSKSTKPGDTIRAMVAFPVTVGSQLAIPAGTYAEGTVESISGRTRRAPTATVHLHFTRLVFANGYSVTLDAVNTEAMAVMPEATAQSTYEIADARDSAPFLGEGFSTQTSPQLPPTPSVGPSPAVVVGAVLGGGLGVLALALALSHRHGADDYVLFESGWQFQMRLEHPLTLDAGQVAAATGLSAAH